MKMCDCNQGRLPCTCKSVEAVVVPPEIAAAELARFLALLSTSTTSLGAIFKQADELAEIQRLRAQLAERDILLQRAYDADQAARHSLPYNVSKLMDEIETILSASAEPSAPIKCAICKDLGDQCLDCEEAEFREWADRNFASPDYRKTSAGVFTKDWVRYSYQAWCARAALERKS